MTMQEIHSSQSKLSSFEDVEECEHMDHIDFDLKIGSRLQNTEIDGVYIDVFHCPGCNHFCKEVYNYEGCHPFD